MVQVRETAAGKSISAWVILNRKGVFVARVQAHYGQSRVLVNVWTMTGDVPLQEGSASGYGYDKFTAALSGLIIDGHKMTDHCGENRKPPKGHSVWPDGTKAPKGYRFGNYVQKGHGDLFGLPEDAEGWTDCWRISGLEYLSALGYQVISAI